MVGQGPPALIGPVGGLVVSLAFRSDRERAELDRSGHEVGAEVDRPLPDDVQTVAIDARRVLLGRKVAGFEPPVVVKFLGLVEESLDGGVWESHIDAEHLGGQAGLPGEPLLIGEHGLDEGLEPVEPLLAPLRGDGALGFEKIPAKTVELGGPTGIGRVESHETPIMPVRGNRL
jgi:hypothetical protein